MKTLFTIKENRRIASDTYRMELSCGFMPETRAGQFVDIALDGFYLRRPIAVCDLSDDGMTICYKAVGKGTEYMSTLRPGMTLDLLTGLGNGFNVAACRDAALLIGGGLGAAPLHLLCRELKATGKKVSVVLGFNKAEEIILIEEYRKMGVEPGIATLDGSAGTKGFVGDVIARMSPEYDRFYCCGPLPMMKAVCESLPTGGEASLEERMGCGAGFCYGCTRMTRGGAKRICKDGPVFDKEEIIW